MDEVAWTLRPATAEDYDFLYALHVASMRDQIEQTWGWDDEQQVEFFRRRFDPANWEIIQAGGQDVGVLIVERQPEEIPLAEVEILPDWQGRGLGSSVLRSLMAEAVEASKPLTLCVLRANDRARALYERVGFRPCKEIETHTYLRWEPGS